MKSRKRFISPKMQMVAFTTQDAVAGNELFASDIWPDDDEEEEEE